MMLYHPDGFREAIVEEVVVKLTEHHDALRMVYKQDTGKIVQMNRGDRRPSVPPAGLRRLGGSGRQRGGRAEGDAGPAGDESGKPAR
ncbi:hypothetical protein ACFSQ7_40885 [Paenibacillus rhizoplanae]